MAMLALLLALPAAAQDAGRPPVMDAGVDAGLDAGAAERRDGGTDAGLAAMQVVFRDFPPGQPIQLWSDGGVVTHTLHLDEMWNARVDDVRVRATGLLDESGVSASPVELLDESDAGVALGALDSIPVMLRARIDHPGTYRSRLTILYGGREQGSTEVVITWPRSVLNVGLVDAVTRVRGTTPPWSSEPSVRIPLTLRETAGLPVTLSPPVLSSLTVQEDAADTATAYDVPVKARALVEVDGGTAALEGPFVLGRGQVLPVQLDIDSELPGAGLYKGTVSIVSPGGPPLDATFTLYLRESWGMAFLLILLGVLVSYGIRTYQTVERPRLLIEHRAQTQLQSLNDLAAHPDCDVEGQDLVKSLRAEVDSLLREASQKWAPGNLDTLGQKLSVLERKVTAAWNWVRLRKAVLAMSPVQLQKTLLDKLAEVKATLSTTGTSASDMDGVEARLRALPAEIQAAVRQHLVTGLQGLRERVAAFTRASPTSSTAFELARLVVPSLDLVERNLDRDPGAAAQALDKARGGYTSLVADDLGRRFDGAPPAFMSQDEWTALGKSVNGFLAPVRERSVLVDTEAAVLAYEQALKHYVLTAAQALSKTTGELVAKAEESLKKAKEAGQPVPPDAEKTKTDMTKFRDAADAAVRLATEGKLADAQVAYEEVRARYEDRVKDLTKAGQLSWMGAEAPAVPAPGAPPAGVSLGALPDALSQSLRLVMTPVLERRAPAEVMAWIGKRLLVADFLIMLITLLVASVVGLNLLWVNDPLWGGWGDWLVALLWGFGLHQIAHPGLAPLIQRILGPAQATPQPATPAPPAGRS
ncbi:hypothetical protein [Myxococcus sp. RHSTA-1-4]|uniref:hypothetical protein n=1 Tax=Myxococcus sp. RHSTA-1-4 TaxID=2874601 RepID=UPI001CBACA6D|nr:hypothetical protein [Myxococcus sp. RHSTA-1-4]MBZ4422985.1 hypothetical protein [Myxococcus sp. RHSTA-1-4]